MTKLFLLERTAGGVLVNTLDVRGGKTVDDTADQARALACGDAFIDWFMNATAQWQFHVPVGKSPGAVPVDLRVQMLKALSYKGRRSHIREYLIVTEDHRSQKHDLLDNLKAGRDLLDWHQAYGEVHKVGNLTLAVLVNHAWGLYFYGKKDDHG